MSSLVLIEWALRLLILPLVVTRKEKPTAALAWLMVVFFEPLVGLGLYLLFGEDRLVRRRLKLRARVENQYAAPTHPALEALVPEPVGLEATLQTLAVAAGALPITHRNSMQLLADTGAVVDGLVADIDAAQQHVHLMFYIVRDDAVGQRVGEALVRAQRRGVACRLLADAVGSRPFFRRLAGELRAAGVEVRAALPTRFIRPRVARIDLRNHRKLAVIDGQVAWLGSQNLVEPTYGHSKAGAWYDLMARITGSAVWQLQVIFLEDWYHEAGRPLADERACFPTPTLLGTTSLQVIPTGPEGPTEPFEHLIVHAIHAAKTRVCITSPYFVPDESLLCALRVAAARGVEVDVIVPHRSDQRLLGAAGRFYFGQLLPWGVRIHRFQDGLLHAKTLTVDENVAMVGSANFDIRSFQLNFELNVMVHDAHATREVRWVQDTYRAASRPYTLADWRAQGRLRRLAANLAKLFSPLL